MRANTPLILAAISLPVTLTTAVEVWLQDPSAAGAGQDAGASDEERPGIPVRSDLIFTHCSACHEEDREGRMGRISFMRKSPEGWSISLKRMIRLYDVETTPEEARDIVRYLSNEHGLARAEAERGLYESERRVHWSEQDQDQERLQACAACHSLGRILNQQRDADEWKQLKATHLAYFPVAAQSIGRAFPRTGGGNRGGGGNSGGRGGRGGRGGQGGGDQGSGGQPSGDIGDRVLAGLAEELPLFTPEWEEWTVNRRDVPLAGVWSVTGHSVGKGDVRGQVTLTRVATDDYQTEWNLVFDNGETIAREGQGILYAGYSWRGRATDAGGDSWREVLLVDDEWRGMKGRFFTGGYDELGMDIELHRHLGVTQIFSIDNRALKVPSSGHVLHAYGESFPETVQASEFGLGMGVTVTAAEYIEAGHVRLTVDVAADAELGERLLSLGSYKGSVTVVLYDKVDYLRITPLQGLARVGGVAVPKQYERFEAVTVNRGRDGEPYTDDDYDISVTDARWSLEEFPVRENDDDIDYVGGIDEDTGLFTPAIDGPNPVRKWSANNIGNVYVVAETDLEGRRFKARAHLVVTVPLFQRSNALQWADTEQRDGRDNREDR